MRTPALLRAHFPVRLRRALLAAAILAAAGPPALDAQARGAGTGVVMGQVMDHVTRQPLGGVSVRVSGLAPAVTDARGEFVLRRVPAGQHAAVVGRLGYVAPWSSGRCRPTR